MTRTRLSALAASLAVFATAPAARALDCKDLPSPVYGIGGSAAKPLIGKVAASVAALASPPFTVVYQAPGACLGINALLSGTKLTGTASYWDATGKEQTCTLPLGGQDAEFANMGNSATSCPGVSALPADIGDFLGPVNAYALIVPKASSQLSISAEAAYFVFGFGREGRAEPWTDESQIFRRDANSAAQLFIALSSGVPTEKFKGVDTKSNGGTITAVAQSQKPEAAIGLVSVEVADANRSTVRVLAYQSKKQSCGYWPDSTPDAFDKANVRSGQYDLWAPLHFFARVGADKKIQNPRAAQLIGLFTGEVAPPAGVDPLRSTIQSGAIPRCAMRVWRETDLGEITTNRSPDLCHCYFESVATGATSCKACTTDAECGASAPVCSHGYCEARAK